MRTLNTSLSTFLSLCFFVLTSASAPGGGGSRVPIAKASVTLRGKKYDVSDVTTVQDLREQVASQSGVSAKQQGRLIFGGKRLDVDTVLSEAGVPEDGGHLNLVPSSQKKKKALASASASTAGAAAGSNAMKDYLKQSGIDTKDIDEMMKGMGEGGGGGLDEMMKSIGGGAGMDEMMKKMGGGAGLDEMMKGLGDGSGGMQDSLKAMTEAMSSPMFQEMMSDPEKLEQSRQMILSNPMLKSMMSGMPGMEDLLNDKDSWREAMTAAATLYKSMDSETLMKSMMGGMGGMPPPGGPGDEFFDGTLNDSTANALDELDEDD